MRAKHKTHKRVNPASGLFKQHLTLPQRGREAYGLSLWGWWLAAGVICSVSSFVLVYSHKLPIHVISKCLWLWIIHQAFFDLSIDPACNGSLRF